jgi:hypothetical protein
VQEFFIQLLIGPQRMKNDPEDILYIGAKLKVKKQKEMRDRG